MKNKLWLQAIFPCVCNILYAAASTESRVSMLESRMNEISTRTVHGNYGAKPATATPQILGENWFFTGDMLWWHIDEGGTDFAQLFTHSPTGVVPENSVKNRELNFKWDFGFRAGIGTIFNHDKWDLYLNFTWFRADNSAAASLHGGTFLSPLTAAPPLEASQVKAHWRIHFYDMALNLGRPYFISPLIAIHPYFGIKTAWISQTRRSFSKLFLPALIDFKTKTRNDFWGIGPDIGLEGKWFVRSGFNLFAGAGVALFWGDFDVRHQEFSPTVNATRLRLKFDTHQVVPMAQMQLGMGYETNIYHDYYRIAVNVRYEYQYWWQQNQMPLFAFSTLLRYRRVAEDLSLQGITVDVRFDF